jgi:quercetin dioxygenase-like cupin family protein
MIKRIYRSKLDIENLSKLRTSIPNGVDDFDYKGVVVNKPWGYEYLMYENPFVAVWILFIKKSYSTSMHCHPTKKTSLLVVRGKVVSSNLGGWTKLNHGDGLIIDEAVFHSTKAVSRDGAIIMEIESPPNKKDLVRLKDEYGRIDFGYEGTSEMTTKSSEYEYIDFHNSGSKSKVTKKIKECVISLSVNKNTSDIHEILQKDSSRMICLLKGKLHDNKGSLVLSVGEAAVLSQVISGRKIVSFGEISYLTLSCYGNKNKSS